MIDCVKVLCRANVKKFMAVLFVLTSFQVAFSQKSSKNNYTGNWEDANSWTNNVVPPTANIGSTGSLFPFNINGFITRTGNLSFANVNANASGPDFIVNDTLIVRGDITFDNKAANLVLGPNALMIVFGNFTATNRITVDNGGSLIITGDMNFSPSGQDEYNGNGGDLYVGGSVTGNPDASTNNDWSNLDAENPGVWDFVICGGGAGCTLPVELLYFNAVALKGTVSLTWATSSEENFDRFMIQRSLDGKLFTDIGEVSGAGNNTYDIITKYQFEDTYPVLGLNYYRLMAIDLDDKFEYFPVAAVKVAGEKSLSVYPNPSSGISLSVHLNFSAAEDGQIQVLNAVGVEMLRVSTADFGGELTFQQRLLPGVYFVKYVSSKFQEVTRITVRN